MMLYVFAAMLGLCVGSFLHTCVHRLPRGRSVLSPRSHCPACGTPLGPVELIPLVGFALSRGKCRRCGATIGAGHLWMEAGTGVLAVAVLFAEGPSLAFVRTFSLAAVFLAVAVVDIRHRVIPDAIVGAGLVVVVLGTLGGAGSTSREAFAGLAAGGGTFALIKILYHRIRGREGMGAGDVKLSALIGAALGVAGWLQTVLIASLVGTAVGVGLIFAGRAGWQTALPFGAFLSVAAIASLFGMGVF